MFKAVTRTPVAVLAGRAILSAYIFEDQVDTHGVVFTLDDGSDVSIEFDSEVRFAPKVFHREGEDGEAVLLQTPE